MTVASVRIPGRHGYSVEFSPYFPNRFACASSQNFGIAGTGTLFLLEATANGINILHTYEWTNSLFDVTWSESSQNVLVTGSGDGTLQAWHTDTPQSPVKVFKGHTKEVHSVHWCQTRGLNFILSASWDQTIKMWDILRDEPVVTFAGHEYVVYSAIWSPFINGCFASTSGDKTLRIWDVKKAYMPMMVIPAHDSEIITCDWCKYNQNLVVTGGVDGSIRGWDLRNFKQPVFTLRGHDYAIRRLKCSPFDGRSLATCSYDFTVRLWDITQPTPVETIQHHTEFVCGIDYNMHIPGQVVDCAWDETVKLYSPQSLQTKPQEPPPLNQLG